MLGSEIKALRIIRTRLRTRSKMTEQEKHKKGEKNQKEKRHSCEIKYIVIDI